MNNTTEKARAYILKNTKLELAEALGISRPTLDTRLGKGNWKKLEISQIEKLTKNYSNEG